MPRDPLYLFHFLGQNFSDLAIFLENILDLATFSRNDCRIPHSNIGFLLEGLGRLRLLPNLGPFLASGS